MAIMGILAELAELLFSSPFSFLLSSLPKPKELVYILMALITRRGCERMGKRCHQQRFDGRLNAIGINLAEMAISANTPGPGSMVLL